MILKPSDEDYKYLPGLSVLIGGMWIANLSYWGFNQYITQRAFAAKSLKEAQKGVVMKIVIEPSSAVPIAALLENKFDYKGQKIGIILSGGNVDLEKLPWIL